MVQFEALAICPRGYLPYIQITSIVLAYIRLPYKHSVVYILSFNSVRISLQTKHPVAQ